MRFFFATLILVALPLSACGTGTGRVTTTVTAQKSEKAAAPGEFQISAKPDFLEDSAGPITGAVSAVTLAVEKVVAFRADGGNPNVDEGVEADGVEGWEVLVDSPKTVELLGAVATNATQTVLGTSELAEGNYTQIRLYLSPSGNSITVSGVEHPLTIPSSAIKLVGNAAVEADNAYRLNLHFDLDHSLVVNAQGYKLKPTVKYSLSLLSD